MKVLKVIVDEMPKSCEGCPLTDGVGSGGGYSGRPFHSFADCMASGCKTHDWNDDEPSRPEWCPLVEVDDSLITELIRELSKIENKE